MKRKMYCCLYTPKTNQTKPKHKNIATLTISDYFWMSWMHVEFCWMKFRTLNFSYMFMTDLYEIGVILTDNWLYKKERLGINYPKNINNIKPQNSIQDPNSFSVLQAYFTSTFSQGINYYIELHKLRDFYECLTEILMAWWAFGDTNLTNFSG